MKHNGFGLSLSAVAVLAGTVGAQAASATLTSPEGANVGVVELAETPNGVRLHATLTGLSAGVHGFHIHETGSCTPDFSAAGGHLAGGAKNHGFDVAGGPHAGDMPNIHVPETGNLEFEVFNPAITFGDGDGALFDGDGSAIVIHDGGDDYESQPSGAAGDRIACGVIEE